MVAYHLLTATKYDPVLTTFAWNDDGTKPSPFFLLHLHFDRLRSAAIQHDWTHAAMTPSIPALSSLCLNAVHGSAECSQAYKIRITLAQSGDLSATASPTQSFISDPMSLSLFDPEEDAPILDGSIWTVFLDTKPTQTSLFTITKTSHRDLYRQARIRASILDHPPSNSEVILYNHRDLLTEASTCNIAVHRSGQWVTPSSSTGCLPGVLRRWLLEQGRIREDEQGLLNKHCLREGEWVLLFNGVQGCRLGRLTLRDRVSTPAG